MTRRVYTPNRHRTFHNGVFKEATTLDPIEDAEFCNTCDAITLHAKGLCVLCFPKMTMTKITNSKKTPWGNKSNE
jgi:molybdenum cofactor biosynthesis enzyme MoaA